MRQDADHGTLVSGRPGCNGRPATVLNSFGGVMKDVQRVAIVDPSDTTRDPLRNLLLGVESVWLEAECSRYEFFIDVARQSAPDLVVISLDSDHNKALQLISQLTVECPNMGILAVSNRN